MKVTEDGLFGAEIDMVVAVAQYGDGGDLEELGVMEKLKLVERALNECGNQISRVKYRSCCALLAQMGELVRKENERRME